MNSNEYGQITFSNTEIIDVLYAGGNIGEYVVDIKDQQKHDKFASHFDVPNLAKHIYIGQSADEFHLQHSSDWTMPDKYKNMDIEKFLVERLNEKNLKSDVYAQRLSNELSEFRAKHMIDILKFLCYLMYTCEQQNIVTGIGRGSSVSSLVLHLLDVHQIDPVKYNLDYKEFLR